MSWQLTYHLLPQVAAIVVGGALAITVCRDRSAYGSVPVLVMLVGIVGWAGAYGLQFASPGLESKQFWNDVQFLFVLATVLGYFSFAAYYTSNERWIRQPVLQLLVVPAAITLALVFTNDVHGLIRTDAAVTYVDGLALLQSEWGFWFWIHMVYTNVLVFVAIAWIVRFAYRNWAVYRDQAIVVVFAALVPWALAIPYVFGLTAIEYSTFGLPVSTIAFAWAVYRYDLLDLVPIARERVVEEMRDGVIVLDIDDRIVDCNEAAVSILAADRQTDALGANVLTQLAVSVPVGTNAPEEPDADVETSRHPATDGGGGVRHDVGRETRGLGSPTETGSGSRPPSRFDTGDDLIDFGPLETVETDIETFVDEEVETVDETSLEELFDRDPLESYAAEVTRSVDGTRRHYVLSISPLCGESGQLTGRLVVAEEVTAIRRRERELRAATTTLEERSRQLQLRNREQATLIENLPGVVYRCTDLEHGDASFVSSGAATLTGYDADAFESGEVTLRSIVHPDDRETVFQQKAMAIDDGSQFDVTYRIVTNDDTQRWVRDIGGGVRDSDASSPSTSDTAPEGSLEFVEGFVLDVTENKQREQLQVLTRVLRHNIRNEMNVISGRVELALANAAPETRRHLEVVARAAHRVTRLGTKARQLQVLLDADGPPEIGRLDVVETVDRAIDSLRQDHPDDVLVETTAPERLDAYATELLDTAVYELLENAAVHADEKPVRIDVTIRTIGEENERAEIRIADDGPGIPAPELEVLDDRMESPLVHGSGLGLWIVRWIVDASGELELSSRGTGTTAVIRLPREGERLSVAEDRRRESESESGSESGSDTTTGSSDETDESSDSGRGDDRN